VAAIAAALHREDRPIPEGIDPSAVFLFRNTEARFLDMDARTIGNNPSPHAIVSNRHISTPVGLL
jgi:hypothetical protein